MFIFNSSIGKKFVQAVSGAFLIIFLLLFKLGCDFMSTPVISILVPVLALGFLVHIIYGCWLTWKNIKARGGYKRYEVKSRAAADSWSARNMFVLGLLIVLGIAVHLTHFWAYMQLPEMFGIGNYEDNPYDLLMATFGSWWVLAIYLVWFVVLWFHLTHGFWSMFQTVGWDGSVWFKRIKVIGVIVATLICVLLAVVAVNGFIEARMLA